MIPKTWRLFLSGLILLGVGYVVKHDIDDTIGICMMIIGFLLVIVDRFVSFFRWSIDE